MRPKASRFDQQPSDKELQSAEPSVGLMPESEVSAHVMPAPADLICKAVDLMPESDSAHVMPFPEPIMPSVTLPEGETGDKELQSVEPSVGLMPESDASAHVISMPAPADPEAPVGLMPESDASAHVISMPAPADPEAPVDLMRESDSAHVMPVHAPDDKAVELKNSSISASLDGLMPIHAPNINEAMDHDGAVLEAVQRYTGYGTTLNGFYDSLPVQRVNGLICTTVLLYYCTTVLLYYCTTVLLYYCTTVLLYYVYCTTVLAYYTYYSYCTTTLVVSVSKSGVTCG